MLANEPNLLHTFISYRVARLSNTHEIGMSRKRILAEMRGCGFTETVVVGPRFNDLVTPHWIADAQVIVRFRMSHATQAVRAR